MREVTLLLLLLLGEQVLCCPMPGLPRNGVFAQGKEVPKNVTAGTEVTYACKKGFQMLGRNRRVCLADGSWSPRGLPYCVADVAATKEAYSSEPRSNPKLAMDGNRTTCSDTLRHLSPWYIVDLEQALPISVVKLDLPASALTVSLVVRVGNLSTAFENSVCNEFKGDLKPGRSLYLPCVSADSGRYVSVHMNEFGSLSICEIAVYSEVVDVEDSEATTTRSSDPTIQPPNRKDGVLGIKSLTGLGLGIFVLLAPICCCCWFQRCRKCCCKKSTKRPVTGVDNGVFTLCEHPIDGMYANSWNDLGRSGTVPTGTSGATARLKDVRVLSPADSFSDVDLSSP
ncbi:hypothetical protein HPB50_020541 [Hyalomma asiaticum]|uniref:Uncharacterized protein n=1 Tax=Hyalomma asiaticum TaxID=266040 RepID=A0ACB7TRZ4_HYAAI|nr:hypothetical protein HPB50_020541 [Hyalomma asiaticum]